MHKKYLIKLTVIHNKKKKENSQKNRNRGDLPQLNKTHVHRTPNSTLMGKRQCFSPMTRNEAERSALLMLFSLVLEVLATAISREKEIKGILIRRKERKLSLYADDMAVYIANPKESTKKPVVSSAGSWETYKTNCIRVRLK